LAGVSDQWQGHGIGTQLLKLLVQIGRDEQLERITATMLADNREMQHLAREAGFSVAPTGGGEYGAELVLLGSAFSLGFILFLRAAQAQPRFIAHLASSLRAKPPGNWGSLPGIWLPDHSLGVERRQDCDFLVGARGATRRGRARLA